MTARAAACGFAQRGDGVELGELAAQQAQGGAKRIVTLQPGCRLFGLRFRLREQGGLRIRRIARFEILPGGSDCAARAWRVPVDGHGIILWDLAVPVAAKTGAIFA